MSSDRYIGAQEVADMLGIELSTLYRRRSDGEDMPPAIKFGRNLRWRESSVHEFLARYQEKAA